MYVLLPVWYSNILGALPLILYWDLPLTSTYLYAIGIALYLGSLVVLLQISRRDLKKDLRRELKKVLL